MRVYFDHNATTPIEPQVADAMFAIYRDEFGNPSSVHHYGQRAKAALDAARSAVAALIHADPSEVVFTGSGTEADNLAVRGVVAIQAERNRRHVVTAGFEHEAVLNTAKALGRAGYDITVLPLPATGVLAPEALQAAMRDDTALVSVMHANNEVGTVQPIADLAAIAHEGGALFHTDAVQSLGKIDVNVRALGVDLASFSAHKLYGPKAVGALWIKRGVRLAPVLTGGRQERNRRPGTENVAGIVGFGVASRLAAERVTEDGTRLAALRDRLETAVLGRVPGTAVNGGRASRVPNTTNISFAGVEAESLLIALDLEGIAVSTGSACSSGTLEPSHVLKAMGLPAHRAQSSIRFSLGRGNSDADVDRLLDVLPKAVERLRALASGAR
ncbi:MAG: cysteine desulfurase family protein [Bacteroidales bacterium]